MDKTKKPIKVFTNKEWDDQSSTEFDLKNRSDDSIKIVSEGYTTKTDESSHEFDPYSDFMFLPSSDEEMEMVR